MSTPADRVAPAAFANSIDALTLGEVSAGPIGFGELLRRLPSIYPTEVLISLDRLARRGLIPARVASEIRHDAGRRVVNLPEGRSLLPLPHPLDYEWRFTSDTSRALLHVAGELTPRDGKVLLFGTPGLAVEALSLPIDRRVSFLSEDNAVTRRVITLNRATGSSLSIAFCSGGLPRETADAVLLDPPWYMDFIRPMLAAAAAACRTRGVVLISMPPAATRPSAESDRVSTVRFATRLGLELIEHQPLAVGYDTPFFETNALAAEGIYPPPRWRRGDFVVFRKTRIGTRPLPPASGRRRDWFDVTIGRMRLFVKRSDVLANSFAGLIPLIEGDVLPSVSRRDLRRRSALIWTSGNRIFGTDNPALVLQAALSHTGEQIGAGAQPNLWGNLPEAIERVGQQLATLAALEADEERRGRSIGPDGGRLCSSGSMSFYSRSMATVSG
jgi:hypothetical protein